MLCKVNVSALQLVPNDKGIPIPCCEPCRCDDDCHLTDDCCPDVIPRVLGPAEVMSKNSNPLRCTQVQYPLIPMTEVIIQSYEMVSVCPSDYSRKDVKEKCERDYDKSDLLDTGIIEIIPVSDKRTLMPYKNINCAFCSEVNADQVIPWVIKVVLVPILFPNGIRKVKALHDRSDCKLSYTAQDSIKPGVKKCKYLIDRCNSTRLPTSEISLFERACASYTSIYKHYKNVHCYACSGNANYSKLGEECFLSSYVESIEFTGVLYFNEPLSSTETEYNSDASCSSTSVYGESTNTCYPVFCSDMTRLSGLQCEPYYTQAYQISYEIRAKLFPRFNLTGLENVLKLMDNIKAKLFAIDTVGRLVMCIYDYAIHLNISEDRIGDVDELAKVLAFEIDLSVSYGQESGEASDVSTEIKSMLKVYETISSNSGDFAIEYIAEDHESSTDSVRADNVPDTVNLFPPTSTGHMLTYIVNKENLVTVILQPSVLNNVCLNPIRVSYLHMCAKVVLSDDSFTRHFDENNSPVVKVLGEVIETNDVVVNEDGSKIMICAERYLRLVQTKQTQSQGDNEKPVSQARQIPLTERLTIMLPLLLSKMLPR